MRSPEERLRIAIDCGNLRQVRKFVKEIRNINNRFPLYGSRPLNYTLTNSKINSYKKIEILKILINGGAYFYKTEKDLPLFLWVASHSDTVLIRFFLSHVGHYLDDIKDITGLGFLHYLGRNPYIRGTRLMDREGNLTPLGQILLATDNAFQPD